MIVRLATVKWPGKKQGKKINALFMLEGNEFRLMADAGTPEAEYLQGLKAKAKVAVLEHRTPDGTKATYRPVELGEEFKIAYSKKEITYLADALRKSYDEVLRAFKDLPITDDMRQRLATTLFINYTKEQ